MTMKAEIYTNDLGTDIKEEEIPADLQAKAKEYQMQYYYCDICKGYHLTSQRFERT